MAENRFSDFFVEGFQKRVRLNVAGQTEFLYGHIPVAVVDAAYPEQTKYGHGLRESLDCLFERCVPTDRNLYHGVTPFSYNLVPSAEVR